MPDTNFFQQRREALGLTQRDISIALGVTEGSVGNWERGVNLPRMSLINKLAEVYKVSTAKIASEISAMIEATAAKV